MGLVANKNTSWIPNAATLFLYLPDRNSPAPSPELLLHAHNQFRSAVPKSIPSGSLGSKPKHKAVATSACPCCPIRALQQSSTLLIWLYPYYRVSTHLTLSRKHPTSLLTPTEQPEKLLPAGLKSRASSYK